METNRQLIHSFYEAFQRRDGKAMAACYADNAVFSDPVFPALEANQVRAMWRMFCEGESELSIEFSDVVIKGDVVHAHWEARYLFPATGRPVHNCIDARFRFSDSDNGAIVEHRDSFPFWRWTRMALGAPGLALGWTPIIRGRVRKIARARLDKFASSSPSRT